MENKTINEIAEILEEIRNPKETVQEYTDRDSFMIKKRAYDIAEEAVKVWNKLFPKSMTSIEEGLYYPKGSYTSKDTHSTQFIEVTFRLIEKHDQLGAFLDADDERLHKKRYGGKDIPFSRHQKGPHITKDPLKLTITIQVGQDEETDELVYYDIAYSASVEGLAGDLKNRFKPKTFKGFRLKNSRAKTDKEFISKVTKDLTKVKTVLQKLYKSGKLGEIKDPFTGKVVAGLPELLKKKLG